MELDDSAARTEGDLCARHAAALVLPRGWQLHDERIERPDIVDEAPARPKRARPPRTPRPTLRAVPEPQPQLDLAEPEQAVEPAPDVEPEIENEQPPEPEPETLTALEPSTPPPPIADLDDVFDARTPLLRRAFENVWPLDDSGDDNSDDDKS